MGGRGDGKPSVRTVYDEPLARMGRRRFVETLVGAGFTASMAACLTVEEFEEANDDEVPIVYGIARTDPDDPNSLEPRTKTVPAWWYDEVEAAFSSNRKLALEIDGSLVSSVIPGTFDGGQTRLSVELSHERFLEAVPSAIERVPVAADVVDALDVLGNTLGRNPPEAPAFEERPIPAGFGMDVPASVTCSDGSSIATLSAPLYDPETEVRYFVTSNHLFGGDQDERRGMPCFLVDEEGEFLRIGAIEYGYANEDFTLVLPNDGFVPAHRIDGASPSQVLGGFTRWGLADLKARGEELEKIGRATGHTTGPIQRVDAITCAYGTVCQTHQLAWGSEDVFSDGDSGSVAYHPDPQRPDEGVLIAGLNNARTWWPGADYVWGTAAYAITDRYGFVF